jgi:Aspartyl/Asparaginyl beta-hydroxylase
MLSAYKLSLHTGWEDLANHVLRCHINLDIPSTGKCGMYVDGEVQYHEQGEILVFDDSKSHGAFNDSVCDSRVILIVDMVRPDDIPKGRAKGGHTAELDKFVDSFR